MHRVPAAIALLALLLLVAPAVSGPQPLGRPARVGWLSYTVSETVTALALRQGLAELGYVEGRDFVLELRRAEGRLERLPGLAAELLSLKVDILLASGTLPTRAALGATKTIPIVFMVGDPVGQGFVQSLARPGGNATGFAITPGGGVLAAKQLELLKESVPRLSRVAFLRNPANPSVSLDSLRAAAGSMKVEIVVADLMDAPGLPQALEAMRRARVDGLLSDGDPLTDAQFRAVGEFALRHRLPGVFPRRSFVTTGGLMSYSPDLFNTWKRAAVYVDKILKGARPAELPVEEPAKYELVVNLKTARALGVTVPPSVLVRANEVIE